MFGVEVCIYIVSYIYIYIYIFHIIKHMAKETYHGPIRATETYEYKHPGSINKPASKET